MAVEKQLYKCTCCKTVYANQAKDFYSTRSTLYEGNNGRMTVCKACIEKLYNRYVRVFDGDSALAFYHVCEAVGWYYNEETFQSVLWKKNVFSEYVKQVNTGKGKGKSFEDNIHEEFLKRKELAERELAVKEAEDEFEPVEEVIKDVFDVILGSEITTEMKIKWGGSFEAYEYMKLENLYNEMVMVNPRMEETPQDKDYLKKICLTSVLLDRAYTEGDEKKIKPLSDSYSKLMQDSKLRAIDKTEADKSGGLRNFSQLYVEVESDDFIWPWEKYRKIKGVKQDIVDRTIMHIENHTRRFRKEEMFIKPPPNTPKLEKSETDNTAIVYKDFIDVDGDSDGSI